MKKLTYALILPLLVAGGLVFANRESKKEAPKKSTPKPPSAAERDAAMKQWETTPGGISFKKWEASAAGKKVYACEAKIGKQISAFADMEAVITSLSLPPGSRLGFGVMARINGEEFILVFDAENREELEPLQSLKVADKIIVRSHAVSHAPKYAYPIVSGEYVEKDGKVIYKRAPRKGGC